MVRRNNEVKYELIAEAGAESSPEPPLRQLHRVFRGRYRLVIGLALLLAVFGALAGSQAVPLKYRSTGLVKVEGVLPSILYDSPENAALPMFNAYVASQVTFLQSRPVLDAAVATPGMQLAGWPAGPQGIARLQSSLTIERGRGEQIILVSVADANAQLAQTATNAVLDAFKEQYQDPKGLKFAAKERVLTEREQNLQAELQKLREQMLLASEHYGHEAIERMHADKIEELLAIDEKLAELEAAGRGLGLGAFEDDFSLSGVPTRPGDARQLSPLEKEQMELVAEIESLKPKYGPNHPMMRELNRRLEAIRIQIDLRDRSLAGLAGAPESGPDQAALLQASRDRIEQAETRYGIIREETRRDLERLGHQRIVLTGLNERVTESRNQLQQTRRRLDELRVESHRDNPNRVSIVAYGDLPVAPVQDRRATFATAFALFGAVSGAAGTFFLALRDRRARYVDELETPDGMPPIIGVLPELSGDRQSHQRSARSVHQLRNLLDVQCLDPNRNVLAVTSCDRGEGRTSLVLALGASYAGADRKTLIIDADIAQRSLTRELGLKDAPGLCEAIGPENATGQVHQTRQPNLWALPIGISCDLDPEDLSREKLVWLLDALRSRFDAIIIDTGPLFTGIESTLVSAVSDRVIMLVARNQRLDLVRSALARIEQTGADCAGLVFNRALGSDAGRYEAASVDGIRRIVPFVAGRHPKRSRSSHTPSTAGSLRFPIPADPADTTRRAA